MQNGNVTIMGGIFLFIALIENDLKLANLLLKRLIFKKTGMKLTKSLE